MWRVHMSTMALLRAVLSLGAALRTAYALRAASFRAAWSVGTRFVLQRHFIKIHFYIVPYS